MKRCRLTTLSIGLLSLLLAACPAGGGGELMLPPGLSGQAENSCTDAGWPFVDDGGPGAYLADVVTEAPGATGSWFGDASRAVNGVCGAGASSGSTDVYSLSSGDSQKCVAGEKCIVLEWKDRKVMPVEGTDFVVFENPFNRGGGRFIEAVIVEVSRDGTTWCGWNPRYTGEKDKQKKEDFAKDISDVTKYVDVAGLEPVLFNQLTWTDTAADVFDVVKAGGDHFDLTDLSGCQGIKDGGFVYLRLTTANSRSPASFPLPGDSFDQTADIDGVVARSVDAR